MGSDFAGKRELCMLRSMRKEDEAFVYSTWLKAIYYGNRWKTGFLEDSNDPPREAPVDVYGAIDKQAFFSAYHAFLGRLFAKPTICVLICCLKEDQDVILGYSVTEPGVLHFVFVKEPWRRLGIARDLIPANTKVFTHLTKLGWMLRRRDWKFNPFAV